MTKLVAVVAIALLAGQARAGILFADDFEGGASPLWGNERGHWISAGGVYDAMSPSNNPLTYSSLPFILTDFSVDVGINNLQDGGVWLRGDQEVGGVLLLTGGLGGVGTGLYWQIGVPGQVVRGIFNRVDGLFVSGVSDVHLHIEVAGDTYSAFVNGSTTPATTFTDGTFTSGRVALYDFSGQTFDDFRVSVNAVPAPSGVVMCWSAVLALCGAWVGRRLTFKL